MNHRYTLVTLSELLAVNRDSEQGFSTCAAHACADSLRQALLTRARRRAAAAAQLRELIEQLGGDPTMRARLIGGSRRGWVGLDCALARQEDDALVEACERGEDHALEVYRNALDDHLPELMRAIVQRQFEEMMSDHGQMALLRSEPPRGEIRLASIGGHARQ